MAVARLEAHGRIDRADAAFDRAAVTRAVRLIDDLPRSRGGPVARALAQLVTLAGRLSAPRALALFGQLTANDNWFALHGPPPNKTDITGADGIVYRYFSGACFEFHPLANFAALNALAASRNGQATGELAAALSARAVPQAGGGIGWEYYFDYAGGQAPWLSGFSQAVAAQAFSRAAAVVPSRGSELLREANAAFRTIPGRLVEHLSVGPWIRLYGFNHDVVLNAQLQTVISLAEYARAASNPSAARLAASLRGAAAKALGRFDSGYWTYYSLAHDPSPIDYQEYVVQLLRTLSKSDPRFASAATRFATYQAQPPLFRLANAGGGSLEFWVSKPSTVRVSALGAVRELALDGGWHLVSLSLPGHAGIFPVRLEATDWAGNSASAEALPIVRVAAPPRPVKRRAKKHVRGTMSRALSTPPRTLSVGAGVEGAADAALAAGDGFSEVATTLAWPAGATSPDPAVIAALDQLPQSLGLVLNLSASPLPVDAPGRAALASYAAALASQVPALRDLILGPAPAGSDAADYEAALAAVFDAVEEDAPTVRLDGELDGAQTPATTLAALAAAYRASGRTAPLMGGLAFQPAADAAAGLWSLGDLPRLTAALASGFGGTVQTGASLPLLVDSLAFPSTIPADKSSLYPAFPASALSESAQASAYAAALATLACQPTVVSVLIAALSDAGASGGQSGLYYPDGTPKTSLEPVLHAVSAAQTAPGACSSSTPGAPSGTTSPAGPTAPGTTTSRGNAGGGPSPPATPPPPRPLALAGALAFPSALSRSTSPRVHVGCTAACLYLVTLERAGDGTPVLAHRGAITANRPIAVGLPALALPPGRYRFAVWLVAENNPGPVSIERSRTVVLG